MSGLPSPVPQKNSPSASVTVLVVVAEGTWYTTVRLAVICSRALEKVRASVPPAVETEPVTLYRALQ